MVKVVLIDENDKVVGFEDKVKAHKSPFPLHRAISVVIYNGRKDSMLLQKRSISKPTWPLYWSNTCCTHPMKNETYKQSAQRRLKQEMGISTTLSKKFSFIYKVRYDKVYGEHELDTVFVGKYSGPVKPDPDEADGYQWISLKELKRDIKKNAGNYTPWFKIILKKLNND